MDAWNNFNFNSSPNPINGNFNRGVGNNFNTGYMPPAPRYEIIQVNGEAGARNFRMAPNSKALLLDDTAAIIWLAQTDGTGYLTVTPYDVFPHQQVPPIDINNLEMRVSQLEEKINNGQSNFVSNKQSKKQRQQQHADANESTSDSTN